jgi:hypothetical protein
VASSVSTVDSALTNNESFNNSFEVNDALPPRLTTDNLAHHNSNNTDDHHFRPGRKGYHYAASDDDSDGNNDPWPQFISPVVENPLGQESPADSSNMIGAENLDEDDDMSLENGGRSGDMSMLSSQYEASFPRQPSLTASQLLQGTGAAFTNQYLPLTAERTPFRPRQMCHQCRH